MSKKDKISPVAAQKIKKIMDDPALWSQAFLRTFNPLTKRVEPWVPRWYQVKILRDKSVKRVARCGRRTGNWYKSLLIINCKEL